MSLKQWADNGWLRPHQASRQEVADLLSIVDRDLDDAAKTAISADWRGRTSPSRGPRRRGRRVEIPAHRSKSATATTRDS